MWYQAYVLTEIDVSDDVVPQPVWEVLNELCAPNQTILCTLVSYVRVKLSSRTSSASQLAMIMFLRGFQPVLRRAPKPLVTSRSVTVPEVGSAAPMTQATDQ